MGLNSETRYATARQFVLKETLINKLQPYENTVNCKRKSRCRFFLLVRSRTPPISSEFRGEFEHPKPPLSVRHCCVWCKYVVVVRENLISLIFIIILQHTVFDMVQTFSVDLDVPLPCPLFCAYVI